MIIGIDPGPESGTVGMFIENHPIFSGAIESRGQPEIVMYVLYKMEFRKRDCIIIEDILPYGKRPLSKVLIETIKLIGRIEEACDDPARKIKWVTASWAKHAQFLCAKQGMVKDRDVHLALESIYGKDNLKAWGVTNSHTRTALSLVHWWKNAY